MSLINNMLQDLEEKKQKGVVADVPVEKEVEQPVPEVESTPEPVQEEVPAEAPVEKEVEQPVPEVESTPEPAQEAVVKQVPVLQALKKKQAPKSLFKRYKLLAVLALAVLVVLYIGQVWMKHHFATQYRSTIHVAIPAKPVAAESTATAKEAKESATENATENAADTVSGHADDSEASADSSANAEAAVLHKEDIPLTSQEKAEQDYQKALEFLRQYQSYEAVKELQFVLNAYPEFMPARKTLITVLVKEGYLPAAQRYLQVGLRMAPEDAELVTLQARIFLLQQKPEDALAVLQQINPSLVDHTEYYAVLANIQQRLGQFMAAAHIYEQLLDLDSGNAAWWVGLGVALESAQQNNMAIQAYRKAVSTAGQSNPRLQGYAQSRLAHLGG